jgi:hypothetical protein
MQKAIRSSTFQADMVFPLSRGLTSIALSALHLTIMWGPIFNCKWPGKVFQDLFTPRSVADPEFKPLDLGALRAEHPSGSNLSTNSPEKRENPVSNEEDNDR